MDKKCIHCEALKWKEETPGMCCSGGKVSIPILGEPEEPLKSLLLGDNNESRRFLIKIRKYNSCFQMTSFGVENEVVMPGFSSTFTIQGQIYHRIGSLLPTNNEQPKFLQIYFMGNENDEVDRRCQNIQLVEKDIVLKIQRMLHEHNRLINTFTTALERMPGDDYKLVIHPDRTPSGEHERRYNAPLINEVAAMVCGEQFASRDIVLHARDNTLTRVPDTHKFYDALQYPLIFSKGQEGYHFQIPQVDPVTGLPLPNKKVSCMDFYAFHIMIRENDFNIISRCRQLANQFYVDMYVKVESERLRYITLNQTKLRAENYIHLQDAVANDANLNPNDIGRMIILPSSFVNSPRYLHEYTQDAFAYVRTYGRPDLFVTFTCTQAWPEIVNELMPGQSAIDRHDVVARVFRLKVKKLMSVISKGRIFGEVICFMYSIEWQKRGLPHVHILLWLKDKLRPDQIDNIISAEIPDPSTDKTLHDIIVKNMIHGPCGPENPQCPCMKDGKCTKKFPRKLHKDTVHSENGYPLYRRRAPADGGRTASVKLRNGSYVTIDNSWVVPYSAILLKIFNAHINVEACSSVRAIKYICKYINKGSDQAIFNFRSTELANRVNEVHTYQSGRYVSSNEAVWRLLGFPLHERHPTVTHLSVHLENGERVYFTEDNFHERLSTRPKTTLTAFFELCIRDEFARTLMYAEVPRYYTWDATRKTWKRRIQGTSVQNWPGVKSGDALGRVYTVHVTNMECFCLRMLLHHVRGPTSFNDLKKYNNQEFSTFREACEARGLLEDDNHWNITLEEAAQCRSAAKVRMLFAILIATCGLSNPQQLWERYKIQMADDILHRVQHHNPNVTYNDFIFNEALTKIEDQVITITGKDLSDFGLSRPQRTGEVCSDIIRELSYDAASLQQQITESVPRLNPEQRLVFENVVQKIESGEGGLFFLDAPGGTGKTFLLNLLLAQIRKDKGVAVAVASSGIAATLLNGGRTAHSVLKLPLNLAHEEMPVCNITKNSDRGRMLQQCKLLVWDECTMSHKRAIEALDRTIKDIKSNQSIMGGMVVLLAGDFRQTLPVITRGTPADEINACLKASPLWVHVKNFCLTTNMRVQLHSDTQLVQYADALLKIGEDRMETNSDGMITLNREFCNVVCNMDDLKNNVYPDLATNMKNRQWLCERAILAPTNEVVGQINEQIMSDVEGDFVEYLSVDNVMDTEQVTSFPVEFLNSLELSGVPSHKLRLK
ncbi:jg9019, partial [Pararge aegeria aegeria]